METENVDGSEITNVNPDEESQNYIETGKHSEEGTVSVSEHAAEVVEAEAVTNEGSDMANKVPDFEDSLNHSEQMTIDREEELMHKKKNEESILLKNTSNKALKEEEDALNEQERLKAFELEAIMLTKAFSESASDVLQFKDDSNVLDKLREIIKYALALREEGLVSQEHLDTQSNPLQQEMKLRALKEYELDNTKAMLCTLETDLKCLKEKVLDVEGQLKSSMDESEYFKKLACQNEEECIKSFERVLELDNLLVISESRTKEVEHLVTSLKKENQQLYQELGPNQHTHKHLSETERELLNVEEPSVHSNYGLKQEEKSEDSPARMKELENALWASRLKEQDLQEALVVAKDKLSSYEEMAEGSACRLFESEILADVLQGISMDAQENIGILELDLKNGLGREIELQTRLKDCEAKLSVQESSVQHKTAMVKELKQLLHLQANDSATKLRVAKENYVRAETEVKKLSKKLNLLVDWVKTFDEQASHAHMSGIAKEVELQVLYGKLAEANIIMKNLQAKVLVAETRAHAAEVECTVLANKNSKVDEELANLEAYMDEIQTTLHRMDNEKQSVAYQLTSTTKHINGLTRHMADERQHLQKQISTMVKDNLDLTKKYLKIKNDLDIFLANHDHESHQKTSNEREGSHVEDLELRCCKGPTIEMALTGLQCLQSGENKSDQVPRGAAIASGDFGGSLLLSELKDNKTECLSQSQAVRASSSGSFPYLTFLSVVLVLVIGLVMVKLV